MFGDGKDSFGSSEGGGFGDSGAPDLFQAIFPARISAATQVAGLWLYDWTEQSFQSDGTFTDADSPRAGAAAAGPLLVELNNQQIEPPCYAWVRLRGVIGGSPYYEFSASVGAAVESFPTSPLPPTPTDIAPTPVPPGWGYIQIVGGGNYNITWIYQGGDVWYAVYYLPTSVDLLTNVCPTFYPTQPDLHACITATADQVIAYNAATDQYEPKTIVGGRGGTSVFREAPSGAVDGANAIFTLAHAPLSGTDQVFLNGLLQEPGASDDYVLSGAVVTFNAPPFVGDRVRASYQY